MRCCDAEVELLVREIMLSILVVRSIMLRLVLVVCSVEESRFVAITLDCLSKELTMEVVSFSNSVDGDGSDCRDGKDLAADSVALECEGSSSRVVSS